MKVTLIAGARPNFIKIAPIVHAIQKAQKTGQNLKYRLVHTGQHYDEKMSETFFRELNIPEPDVNLGCGGGTQGEQTAAIILAFEKELMTNAADLVMVVGDVTSTMACSIVAKKLNTKVAHVEAGIRSFDLSMPEEINRMVTDCLTDYFFTTTPWAGENLRKAGIPEERLFWVGNVMIDTLLKNMPRFKKPQVWDQVGLNPNNYIVMTLHRPANVDTSNNFTEILEAILEASRDLPVIFPVHPRTRNTLNTDVIKSKRNLVITDPLGYLEFNYLVKHAKAVITDSGGITEETTVMGVPCITLRDNTERPETVELGTNELIGTHPKAIQPALIKLFTGNWKKGSVPAKWDGNTAERIVEKLIKIYG